MKFEAYFKKKEFFPAKSLWYILLYESKVEKYVYFTGGEKYSSNKPQGH